MDIISLKRALSEKYQISDLNLSEERDISGPSLVMIAKPKQPFTTEDKYKLDQYIMGGGKVIFLLDLHIMLPIE